jgi:ABC-2 type transport system permease protein
VTSLRGPRSTYAERHWGIARPRFGIGVATRSDAFQFGLGLGAIIRHTAAAITVVVGIVCVGGPLNLAVRPYLPIYIVSHSLSATTPLCRPGAASCWLSAWSGLGMLAVYAAIAMVLGALILARRDA